MRIRTGMWQVELRGDTDGVEDAVETNICAVRAILAAAVATGAVSENHTNQAVIPDAPRWTSIVVNAS